MQEYGVRLLRWQELPKASAIVAAVSHQKYQELSLDEISDKLDLGGVFVDVKAGFSKTALQNLGYNVWRL